MRILIVGSDKIYAIENFYKKYLSELGEDVKLFTAQNYFYEYYQKSIINKLLYRASLSGIITKINNLFISEVKQFKPDIIWIFKGMEITPESLEWARQNDIKLVNYNPDNPFIFSGRGSGNQNVTNAIPLYNLHFTYNLAVKKKMETDFNVQTEFLPFGYDLENDLYLSCSRQEEILKVCFAGNPDKERVAFLENMASSGIQIDVFGNNWSRFVKHAGIKVFEPVYGDEFWRVLARYRVQLNLMRVHNIDSHNMRSFEVPAVGGIMLAPDTVEHKLFFKDGQQAFWFSNIKAAVEKANYILGLSTQEAVQIRMNARERSLRSGYSYRDRSKTALEKLKALQSEI
jgi:spore maturation protein CgeB